MPWFKVDDNLAFHAKAVAAGNPAMGLWVRAGSWCAQQLTDGFVPDHMLAALGTKQQADRLVSQRLWDRTEGGYRFHGWVERQPRKEDVEAERAAARDRMKAFRAKKKGTAQDPSPQVSDVRSPEPTPNEQGTSGEVRDLFVNPDPTQPGPSPDPSIKGAKRATQRSSSFKPSEKHQALAAELGVDLRREWVQFCDHHDAKASKFVAWDSALNTWIRNAAKFAGNVRPLRAEPDEQGRIILPPLPGNEWSGR